jgi:single-strand DNA-binding protein
MPNFCKIHIEGHAGGQVDARYTPNGKAVTKFSVAVNDGKDQYKQTTWFRCECWGDTAERVAGELKKGDPVKVVGKMVCEKYNDKEYWKVKAFEVEVLEKKGKRQEEEEEDEYIGEEIPF